MRTRALGAIVVVVVTTCGTLEATDKWESESSFYSDNSLSTSNQLAQGAIQTHDIQGTALAPDFDYSYVAVKPNHSYEVRVFNGNMCWAVFGCADLWLFDEDGVAQHFGSAPDGVSIRTSSAGGEVMRWISTTDANAYVKVFGYPADATSQYDIQMRDTTYLIPRWNNSGTQITVLLIQNGTTRLNGGSIFFYTAAGVLLAETPFSIPGNGLLVIATPGIAALAGASGSATIVHYGTYGALAGKAVALEPATGFAFDTPIVPIPY